MRLARPAEDISLLDVIQVIDGPIALNRCVAEGEGCPRSSYCPIHEVWNEAQQLLIKRLASTHFANLASRAEEMESVTGKETLLVGV